MTAMTLRNWLKRGVAAVSQKDIRLGRWLLDANDVLAIRIMAELQQQCGTDPMQSSGIGKRCAQEWYQHHVMLGDDRLVCLIALNDGSPIFWFGPLPRQIPAAVAERMGDREHAKKEILSGAHLRIPVHTLAVDVQERLSNVLAEQGE
jgi:hypothetical protein